MTRAAPGGGDWTPAHTREDARLAKRVATDRFRDDREVTSIGLGCTEDRTDHAVVITISSPNARRRIPASICDVPTRIVLTGDAIAFGTR